MKKLIKFLIMLAVVFAVKFGISTLRTSIEIERKQASHHGWDDFREELKKLFIKQTHEHLNQLSIKENDINDLVDCQTNAYLDWLNTTDCYYLYNKRITSHQKHIKRQDACLEKASAALQMEKISLSCIKKTIPNKWGIYESMFKDHYSSEWEKILKQRGIQKVNKEIPYCATHKFVEFLETLDCRPMNLDAENLNDLWSPDICNKHTSLITMQGGKIWNECTKKFKNYNKNNP